MLLKFKIPAQSEVVAHITRRSEELQRDGLFGEKKIKRLEEEVERLRKERDKLIYHMFERGICPEALKHKTCDQNCKACWLA